jgi:hypothetical protein
MYCCVECFNDDYLKKIIKQEGLRGNCYFCGSKNKMCIDPIKLYDYFQPVVDLYSPVENIMSTHDIKAGYGDFLENKLQEEWCIFSYNNCENYKELLDTMFQYDYKMGPPQFLNSRVVNKNDYWGIADEITDKMEEQWNQFTNELKYQNRYFPENGIDLNELAIGVGPR